MRRRRGLTLLEMLMVVAILALLAVVLILYLLPSDDRRVRLEAERLAAYLDAAGAEAIMRDGPVRVALDMGEQFYDREAARVGADIRAMPFEDDPGVERQQVRAPVKLTTVIVPGAGDVSSGSAWLLWKARDTDGGVCVLELNDAVWSVIVDPNNGEVRVERGRATLPALGPGIHRSPLALGLPQLGNGEGDIPLEALGANLGNAPTGGPGASGPGHDPGHGGGGGAGGAGGGAGGSGGSGGTGGFGGTGVGGFGGQGGTEEPDEEPDAALPDAEPPPECTTDSECHSPLKKCFEEHCVFNPAGEAFRMTTISAEGEGLAGLGPLIGQILQPRIDAEAFNLIVYFRPGPTGNLEGQGLEAFVVQGQRSGASGNLIQFRQTPELPSFPGTAQWSGGGAGQYAYEVVPLNFEGDSVDEVIGRLDLWLPNVGASGSCKFQRFTVKASLSIRLTDAPGGEPRGRIQVSGTLRKKDAEKYSVSYNGQNMTLVELFETSNTPMNADVNNDGQRDGWYLSFGGDATRVAIQGNPQSNVGVEPPGCGDD